MLLSGRVRGGFLMRWVFVFFIFTGVRDTVWGGGGFDRKNEGRSANSKHSFTKDMPI